LTAWVPPGVTVNRVGSMFTFFLTPDPVTDWESAARSDKARFRRAIFYFMLERGISPRALPIRSRNSFHRAQ